MLGASKDPLDRCQQDKLYEEANVLYGPLLRRLAWGYEADPDLRRDLLQEMHVELWRSIALFDHRCAVRTWVFRVANNVGASHVIRRRRMEQRLVALETLDADATSVDGAEKAASAFLAAKLLELIHKLKPLDRQIMLLYLEGEAAEQIADIAGLSSANVATKIHRIKRLLSRQFTEGAAYGTRD